jgi:hypothetical protein
MKICDICIQHNIAFRIKHASDYYCKIEQPMQPVEGKYREITPDENEDYNYYCRFNPKDQYKEKPNV